MTLNANSISFDIFNKHGKFSQQEVSIQPQEWSGNKSEIFNSIFYML